MATNWAVIANQIAALIEDGTPYEAEVNAQNLNLPGFWVTPVSRHFDTLSGDHSTLVFEVYAISTPRGGADEALDELSKMHAAIMDLPEPLNGQGMLAEVAAVQLGNKSPDALPALKITIEIEEES